MTITNGYATLAQMYAELDITDTKYDPKLETAIAAASRQIDGHTGRRFWQDATVVDRQYFPSSTVYVEVDDISTTTGLVVKIDTNDDGTFAQTLTITTNYIVAPVNAPDMVPVQPYTQIRLVDRGVSAFPNWGSGRPSVQVTAKFGWPAIPDDVVKACLVQAVMLFKSSEAPFGAVQLGFDQSGVQRMSGRLHPVAVGLLEPYVKQYA